ncbi:MAG: methyltransferase [Planctomycetes bacterium]|nr:methyltransferase [Planctomycetota bacterium]
MTPRERVYRCLEFRRPDRAPRNLWTLPWVDQCAAAERDALVRDFPDDFTGPGAFLGPSATVLGPGRRARGRVARTGTYVDEWGAVWECKEDGVVGEVRYPPLSDWSALEFYEPPWEILAGARWDAADRAQEANLAGPQQFMLAGTGIRPFERMQFLRGSENLFVDLAYGTAEVRTLRDMVHEYNLRELEGWVRTGVDGVSFMDDWGAQGALLISPAMWREFFKPLYKDYCDAIRGAGKKVFFHSDGHTAAIYEDLIEIGVDAINSQLFCMDIEDLGRRYRGRVTFWGEIDRQHVLPFGSVDDVRRAVGRVRRALGGGTGGVIAECEWGKHTPPENVRAVFEAWTEPLEALP